MPILDKLNIGWRLAVSFGSLLFCLLLIGVIGVKRMEIINAQVGRVVDIDAEALDAGLQAELDVRTAAAQVTEFVLAAPDKQAGVRAELARAEKSLQEEFARLEKVATSADDSAALARMKSTAAAYRAAYGKALQAGERDAGLALVQEAAAAQATVLAETRAFAVRMRKRMDAVPAEAQSVFQTSGNIILGFALFSTLIGCGFSIYVTRSIVKPINEAVQVAETVAAGDLRSEVHMERADETGKLLHALREMNDGLTQIVAEVRGGTHNITISSGEIAAGNQDLSQRTEQQAASLEETAASMDALTQTVRKNGDNAAQANRLALDASFVAERGGAVVHDVVGTMRAINEASKRIVDIIAVIDGIAFQTNILALNAAVEAARAGEAGRGFAVVASEVRGLAQRSAGAAKEIKELISASVEKVDAGTRLVDQAGTTMDEVVSSIRNVTAIMAEIMAASQEQTAGIEQVNRAIMEMDEMTQQNAALVEEAAAAARSMQEQADMLSHVVDRFKLEGGAPVRGLHLASVSTLPARMALPHESNTALRA